MSLEAEMLGQGAAMLGTYLDGARAEADTWFEWIYHTHIRFDIDVTVVAMSLTRAMSELYCQGSYDKMPEVMHLLACFLLRQEDAYAADEMILNLDHDNIFEGLTVGALFGIGIKVVKKDR